MVFGFVFENKNKKIKNKRKMRSANEKEKDKEGPDQSTEESEETIYETHPRNETKKGREGNTRKRQ